MEDEPRTSRKTSSEMVNVEWKILNRESTPSLVARHTSATFDIRNSAFDIGFPLASSARRVLNDPPLTRCPAHRRSALLQGFRQERRTECERRHAGRQEHTV